MHYIDIMTPLVNIIPRTKKSEMTNAIGEKENKREHGGLFQTREGNKQKIKIRKKKIKGQLGNGEEKKSGAWSPRNIIHESVESSASEKASESQGGKKKEVARAVEISIFRVCIDPATMEWRARVPRNCSCLRSFVVRRLISPFLRFLPDFPANQPLHVDLLIMRNYRADFNDKNRDT
ncbi:hypothetical protein K0M31_019886 [Melipona bicolor]|uniref:Uncharacterized protein n=1 Tax=Melipona bicolor TaxID=60889 RepID=A0AA40G0I5_9HYME|nr:hypothetical protein K0M31_019886 [Melipona bicolor]